MLREKDYDKVIRLKANGWTVNKIAKYLGCRNKDIRDFIASWNCSGCGKSIPPRYAVVTDKELWCVNEGKCKDIVMSSLNKHKEARSARNIKRRV